MKRKLFSLLLCALSVVLLMGAGYADETEIETVAEDTTFVFAKAGTSLMEAQRVTGNEGTVNSGSTFSATSSFDYATDYTIMIDGQAAALNTHRLDIEGITYVSVVNMAKMLDLSTQLMWDENAKQLTLSTNQLTMTAKYGDLYAVANGRYLYCPHGVVIHNDVIMLPLEVVVEAYGGTLVQNEGFGSYQVTRGSGAILSGDVFYDENDLFWLSRVVFAESGSEPLLGKMGVAIVVINRVENPRYPDTILGVLSQANQFSTYKNGALADRTPNESSIIAAKLVLDGGMIESIAPATHFDSVPSGSWADRNLSVVEVIGGHRFYA